MKILIPVHRSHNCELAVQHVIREFMNNTAMEIHLLNVQTPIYASRFIGKAGVERYHHDEAGKELQPFTSMLDKFGIPYAVHELTGDRAYCITEAARRLHCDLILMGTARKNSLTRWVENSLTNKVIEITEVPVEVIAGDRVSGWERYGIPAGLAALLALLFAAAD